MGPLNERDELKRLAPRLHGLPKADPFTVPDGFFERFPHQVQAAIAEGRSTNAPAWTWWKRAAFALPVLAILATGAMLLLRENTPAPVAVEVTPLPDSELVLLDDATLLAAIEDNAAAITPADLGHVDSALDETYLLAYLEEEGADLTELFNTTTE